MSKYQRIQGGEKNELSGTSFSRVELEKVCDLYIKLEGKQIHELNPSIQKLAEELGRTVRSVENQLLGFKQADAGDTGRSNYNSLIDEIWKERNNEEAIEKKTVSFRTNVLLKNIIGKDLITDDNIAVLELVKNAFDAGSDHVEVLFQKILHGLDSKDYKKENNSKLIISDTGKGMSAFDLENKWLNIAYSEKKEKREEYGRTLAGNKGVGRFSCDRLGKFLTIYTKQKNGPLIKLFIDWRKFEQIDDINLNIQDITFEILEITEMEFKTATGNDAFLQGTYLEISSLRDEWSYNDILSLKRQLERLINPNQSFKSSKFDIVLSAPELIAEENMRPGYDSINGIVRNRVFEKLNFKVTNIQSKITKDGENIITILKDRGNAIFTLVEKNRFNLLKNIKIHIYYLNPYSKAYFTKQTGIRPIDFGSISLFINGFRIPPYGDYGDDWLGMESRKGQGRSRYLGNREVIGRIEVLDNEELFEDEDDIFQIISSRSGIVNNNIFNQLTKSNSPFGYYYKIFRRLERFVVEGINWDSVSERDTNKLEKEVLSNPDWDESKEKYREDTLTRNKRILNVAENIIDARQAEIVKLRINQNFISDLIEEQNNKTTNELESIAKEIEDKHLDPEQIASFFNRINAAQKELTDFANNVAGIDPGIVATSPLSGLEKYSDRFKSLENRLEEERIARIAEAEARKSAEEQAKQLQAELDLEKEKNTYFRSSSRALSEDAKGLVHNMKITSKNIRSNVNTLMDKIRLKEIKEKEILKRLGVIKFNAEKALKISRLITRSNFRTQANTQVIDIVKFTEQYIGIYNDIYDSQITFELDNQSEGAEKRLSVLDLSLVFDDLISNAEKAGANKVYVQLLDKLVLLFSDNGSGVEEKFLNRPHELFELGVTTTDGSGIGLNSVKTALAGMGATIEFAGNNLMLKGATFKITFN